MSVEIPRSRWRFDTIEDCDALVLWYGDAGLMASELIPWFIRLSTLLRRDSGTSTTLPRWEEASKFWLMEGSAGLGCDELKLGEGCCGPAEEGVVACSCG